MLKTTNTHPARLSQAKSTPNDKSPGSLSADGKTVIHIGDRVNYRPEQGDNYPGVVFAIHRNAHSQGDLCVWRQDENLGYVEVWYASELVVLEPRKLKAGREWWQKYDRLPKPVEVAATLHLLPEDLNDAMEFDLIEQTTGGYRVTAGGSHSASFGLARQAGFKREARNNFKPSWWVHICNSKSSDARYRCCCCGREYLRPNDMAAHLRREHGLHPHDVYKPGVARRMMAKHLSRVVAQVKGGRRKQKRFKAIDIRKNTASA